MKYMNKPIFVTGIERSGATLIAQIIEQAGAFSGKTTPMMENIGLKKLVDKYYEHICKVPVFGQFPLPNIDNIQKLPTWKNSVELNLKYTDNYKEDIPWMYKSSRIGQIWPLWDNAYPDAKYIIVRRRNGDVIHSCMKTGFMVAFSNKLNQKLVNADSEQEGWLWWISEHEKRLQQLIKFANCKVIWPERIANGDYDQIKMIIDWLGLKWDEEFVNSISIKLKNSILKERSK